MNPKILATAAMIVVAAIAFVSIGVAYSASTENTGNTLTSEYVVLEQTRYSFSSHDLQFDTVTDELGTHYQLRYVSGIVTIDGKDYYGVQVGNSDTLKATSVGSERTVLDVTVNTLDMDDSYFADFSKMFDWRYILEIECTSASVPLQYAYYDGSKATGEDGLVLWKVLVPSSSGYVESSSLKIDVDTSESARVYTTKLYFAGPAETVNDDSFVRGVAKVTKFKQNSDGYITSISPIWAASSSSDCCNTVHSGYPEGAKDSSGHDLTEQTHRIYLERNSNLMLSENLFEDSVWVGTDEYYFAGWYNAEKNKTYSPRSIFTMTGDMEFTAQWKKLAESTVIHKNVNTAELLEMSSGTVSGSWLSITQNTAGDYSLDDHDSKDEMTIDSGKYILLAESGVPGLSYYTVVMIRSDGQVVFESGKTSADTIVGSWRSISQTEAGDYSLDVYASDDKVRVGGNDYILLVDSGYTLSEDYGVVTISGWSSAMNDDYITRGGHYYLPPNEFVREGYMFVGWTVNDPNGTPLPPATYNKIPNEFSEITIYAHWEPWDSSSANQKIAFHGHVSTDDKTFYVYTDANGEYTMPECFFSPEYEILDDTKGWKFIGWNIKASDRSGYTVAQSDSMPIGRDSDYIISNGTIKFIYESGEPNS